MTRLCFTSHTEKYHSDFCMLLILGKVVQRIVSLTRSLKGQLVKFMLTTLPNRLLIFVEKQLFSFYQKKVSS